MNSWYIAIGRVLNFQDVSLPHIEYACDRLSRKFNGTSFTDACVVTKLTAEMFLQELRVYHATTDQVAYVKNLFPLFRFSTSSLGYDEPKQIKIGVKIMGGSTNK